MSLSNTMEGAFSMEIYTVLKGEHREVSALFKALQAAPEAMDGTREAGFAKLYKELMSHAKAEEATVYGPAEERIPKDDVKHAEKEHKEIETLLEELSDLDAEDPTWSAKLETLMKTVEHHVQEEEGKMFEKMRAQFSEDEAEQMAKRFHEAKDRELKRLDSLDA